MKTITITSRKSKALYEWESKEYGSWEDYEESPDHVYSILQRFGKGQVRLTEAEAKTVLESGEYQSTAWNPDEIGGGVTTMQAISRICKTIRKELNKA